MGQHWDEDDCHRIFIEEGDALAEHSVVHEILHGILREERYPDADLPDWSAVLPDWRNFARDIRNRFVDCLDHQVVYRRMVNDFSLDMPTYFAAKAAGQISAINQTIVDMPSYYPTHSYVMPEILAGLDYPLWGNEEMVSVGHLRELNSDAADYLLQIHKELESTGHSTPEEVFQCGETIRAMILDYGSGHGVSEDILKWWRQLRIFLPTLRREPTVDDR